MEGLGKIVAEELRDKVLPLVTKAKAEDRRIAEYHKLCRSLNAELSAATQELNDSFGRDDVLTVEDLSDVIMFKHFGKITLKVDLKPGQVSLHTFPASKHPQLLLVEQATNGDHRYRFQTTHPSYRPPDLTESQVVIGILRMALDEPFSG